MDRGKKPLSEPSESMEIKEGKRFRNKDHHEIITVTSVTKDAAGKIIHVDFRPKTWISDETGSFISEGANIQLFKDNFEEHPDAELGCRLN